MKPMSDTATLSELIERLKALNINPQTRLHFEIKEINLPDVNMPEKKRLTKNWEDLPVYGMWADRDDIGDATEYVRKLREPRYKW